MASSLQHPQHHNHSRSPRSSPHPPSALLSASTSASSSSSSSSTTPPKAALRPRHPKSVEALERERLVLRHLPEPEDAAEQGPIRAFLWTQLYRFVLLAIQTLFSLYLRVRWLYNTVLNRAFSVLYYHHRTPQLIQKDVRELRERGKFPKHVSVILDLGSDGLDKLIEDVSEISCWCASAGIPQLSVYERTGMIPSSAGPPRG